MLIIGDQLALPLLQNYGKKKKKKGNRVIFCSTTDEEFPQKIINQCSDVIIQASSSTNCIDNLLQYDATHPTIPLADVDRIYLIGTTCLLKEFQRVRQTLLKTVFIKNPEIHASVYSTMQCMLKGVCAQCLQWQIDPETGKRTKAVFACSWPEQPLELIDINNINERQQQNRLLETLNSMWLGQQTGQ